MADDTSETKPRHKSTGRQKVALIDDHRPRWPRPTGIDLSEGETRVYHDLLDSISAGRGSSPIPSEMISAAHAAQAASSASRWRRIEGIIVRTALDAEEKPDLKELELAARRADAASRNYQSIVGELGLRPRHMGKQRARRVTAATGVSGTGKWEDL